MKHYLGVDVSKEKLDVYFNGEWQEIKQTNIGYKELANYINSQNKDIIVICEASGGYEKNLFNYLTNKQIKVNICHANKVRAYAKAKGLLAKTDKLDAKIISEFGHVMDLDGSNVLSLTAEEIRELLKRREQLIADKRRELQRKDKVSITIKKSLERHIKWLESEINNVDNTLETIRKNDEEINSKFELYTSVPGIGPVVALYLIAYLPELGFIDNKQLAALVGVAPFNKDSGKYSGKRYIQGGRKALRNHLYMAAVVGTRWNCLLAEFYQRLRLAGKPAKVAFTAVIRKLICLVNSIAKRKFGWQENIVIKC